jgi:hypothetical protein
MGGVFTVWAKNIFWREVRDQVELLMFLFMFSFISCLYTCTILLWVVSPSEVLFLLARSVFVCFICKFVREFL